MDDQFVIYTPLMWIDKAQTWKMADQLGVLDLIRKETLTCYNGIPGDGCGHCPLQMYRKEGLENTGNRKNKSAARVKKRQLLSALSNSLIKIKKIGHNGKEKTN